MDALSVAVLEDELRGNEHVCSAENSSREDPHTGAPSRNSVLEEYVYSARTKSVA